jgi:raffinose/stachyose/melibiose transport system substrate-binding protein
MKKWLSIALILVLAFMVLAGCAKSEEPNANNGQTAGKQEDTSKGDKQEKQQEKEQEKVTLKLLQFKVEITDKVMQMAEDYMKENPNVVIDAQVSRDYSTLLKTRFASGDAPDIFFAKSYQDLNDWHDKLVDLSNEPWMDKVAPSAIAGMTVDGKKYGFPVAFEGYGFIYNKDLFAKAGIENVPTTLSELKQANEKLKAAGISSYSEGYKEWWVLGQHLFNLPFGYPQDPAASIQALNSGEAKVKDNPYMDGFFDVLDMTLDYGKGAESIGVSYDTQVSDFSTGKTAMMQQGVWTIDSIVKINPDINMGMFAIPLSENPEETRMPVGVPAYYTINKDSKHVDEAKKFLIWLHENGQKYIVDSFKLIPAFTDMKATEELGPLAADLFSYVENDQTIPWAFNLWPSGTHREFAKVLQAYVGKATTKDQAIEEIQKIWDAALK